MFLRVPEGEKAGNQMVDGLVAGAACWITLADPGRNKAGVIADGEER